jgi:tRNA(Ile2) C34 agmatinyltransferase TiaS
MQKQLTFTPGMSGCAMSLITVSSLKQTAEVVSNILNLVCPECGGKMGGEGLEFQCQGRCQTDWRELWTRFDTVGSRLQITKL